MALTENQLWKTCPPRRELDIISQYRPQIEILEKIRNGEDVQPINYRGSSDMIQLIESQLRTQDLAVFKPIELLSRMHRTIKTRNKDNELIQEVSVPIHYGPLNNELIVETEPVVNDLESQENLKSRYNMAVANVIRNRRKELAKQRTTFEDIIMINRRLINKSLRCIRCNINGTITCFKFDWLSGKLL
jgi:hypothetical protein